MGTNNKHDTLCDLLYKALEEVGLEPIKNFEYHSGEMDVWCEGIYYEVKTWYNEKQAIKGFDQIKRAKRYGLCDEGYIVTYGGIYK